MKYSLIVILLVFSCVLVKAQQNQSQKATTEVKEQMPHFKGGDNAFFDYLDKHVKTPENFDKEAFMKKNGNQFVPVSVYFTVGVDGTITDVNVLEHVDDQLDEKAIEIVKNMPKWEPGTQNGKPVKVQYAIPVRFNLM